MKKMLVLASVAILIAALTACAQPVQGSVLQSDKPRVTSPDVPQTDLESLVSDNSAFALELYQRLRTEEGNLFYSPYSMSLALAMTYAGAAGETEQQMAETLHFALPQSRLHPAFNSLALELAKRGEGAESKDGEGFRLNIVNTTWGQKDYKFLDSFLDVLAENYGAGLRIVDFIGAPEEARITINDWVSQQTEDKIKDLIPQGLINELTRLVLTNAIYFNAAWATPFSENATSGGAFRLLDGGEVTVPMMRQTESFGYAEGDGYQAVELPYDGSELSMVILLPEHGQFDNFEASLYLAKLNGILGVLGYREVSLTMPKFEFESELGLKITLSDMGMPLAFTPSADFSGMTGRPELFVTEVVHKAFVSVDEAGTEAAAATAVIVGLTAVPETPVTVNIDRPFIFLIRDIETGVVLFLGRILNPAS